MTDENKSKAILAGLFMCLVGATLLGAGLGGIAGAAIGFGVVLGFFGLVAIVGAVRA